jgi:hypothetical protein
MDYYTGIAVGVMLALILVALADVARRIYRIEMNLRNWHEEWRVRNECGPSQEIGIQPEIRR